MAPAACSASGVVRRIERRRRVEVRMDSNSTRTSTAGRRSYGLTARGESLAAFDERCIPTGCVASRSNTPGILGRRALPAGRLARLGATPDFHHGLLNIAGLIRLTEVCGANVVLLRGCRT